MKNLLPLLTLFFFNLNFAQNNQSIINGNWIKFKVEMKDGSKVFDRFMDDSTHFEIVINKDKIRITSDPIQKNNNDWLSYSLTKDVIKTSEYFGYLIEKVNQDTLILSEKMNDLTNDKLKRLYLVKSNVLLSKMKDKYKNKVDIIASRTFTPKLNLYIQSELSKTFAKNFANYKLKGSLKIYPKERKIKTEIVFSTTNDSTRIKKIKKIIDNSFEKWDIRNFEEYNSVEIPFVLKSEISKNYKGIKIIYLTDDLDKLEKVIGGKYEDIQKGAEYFEKGINAYLNKNYQKAIDFFSYSYKYDPKNLEAIYNKAAVYLEIGDKENACVVWKEISDLGQMNAKILIQEHCK